ncbi:hypothetical protein NCF86_03575 [Pelagerythrobacter marinus]|nr:hypothetical protein NCF86_03575 [Pelagerythrobacter marinus]
MDWQDIQRRICDARGFALTDRGCRVLSDVIMPSGHAVHIHMRPRGDALLVHDGGAAFDELVIHGVSIPDLRGVRTMLAKTNYSVSDDGLIFVDHVPVESVGTIIAFVADASLRAADFMLKKARPHLEIKLNRRLQDTLRLKIPNGRPDFVFQGRNRQHKFDFGFERDGETVLVQSVTPDSASVNAAIVKSLDALDAEEGRAHPVLVFEEGPGWKSDLMNLLAMSRAKPISLAAVNDGALLAA